MAILLLDIWFFFFFLRMRSYLRQLKVNLRSCLLTTLIRTVRVIMPFTNTLKNVNPELECSFLE